MLKLSLLWTVSATVIYSLSIFEAAQALDPCVAIAKQTWVNPAQVRACFKSFPFNETIRTNILDVVNRTFNFQTSINYQIKAPAPFDKEVHVDIVAEFQRIRSASYKSDFDFHLDLSNTIKRLRDGHTVYINFCYDALYQTYSPFPVVLLGDGSKQQVHIAPEAFAISSTMYSSDSGTQLDLSKYSGAAVLQINGKDPWVAINASADVRGGYQGASTRQNLFFSSYVLTDDGWRYSMGDFARQILPLVDSVNMTVKPVGSNSSETITVPYRSKFAKTLSFTDGKDLRAKYCVAQSTTNGVVLDPHFGPPTNDMYNMITEVGGSSQIALPQTPTANLSGDGSTQLYELEDGKTGVLAMGDFSADSALFKSGLKNLTTAGKKHLLIDVTNNSGGFVCVAEWLHSILIGNKSTTFPQPGLDTKLRDPPLAQKIVAKIINDSSIDPKGFLLYNPTQWTNANNKKFSNTTNWLIPPVSVKINGKNDNFSQRLGAMPQCAMTPPTKGLFAPENIVILSNGACASTCALFSILMSKHYKVRTVVVGGKYGTAQQYAGTVGGSVSSFAAIDSFIKTTKLKQDPLAPPDFLTNSLFSITWGLFFGIDNPQEPEEWQNHTATVNFPLDATMYVAECSDFCVPR